MIFMQRLLVWENNSYQKSRILVLVPGQGINPKFGRKRVTYQFTLEPKKIESNKLTDQSLMPQFQIECFRKYKLLCG